MSVQNTPVLQGQVKQKVSFDDVIAQNPDGWAKETPETKNSIADSFFLKHVASQPGFSSESPDTQTEIRTAFNQKYNVGSVAPDFEQRDFFNPKQGVPDQISDYVNAASLYAGGVLDPANDLLNPFWRSASEGNAALARETYKGIESDPGFLGNAYRFHQNRYANMAGQALGAFGAVRNIATRLPEQALSKLPILGRLPAAAQNALAATGIFSGATNAADVAHGKQTPLQAAGNTALDVATAPLGGASRFKNTAIQGASGYASGYLSSLLDDATHGRPLDFERAHRQGGEQGAIGAGMGFGLHSRAARPEQRTIRGRALRETPPVERISRGETPRAEAKISAKVSREATTLIQMRNKGMGKEVTQVLNAMSPNMRARVNAEIAAFDKQNEAKQTLGNVRIQQAVKNLGPERQTKRGEPLPSEASESLRAAIISRHRITPEQRLQRSLQARAELEDIKTQEFGKREQIKTAGALSREKGKTIPVNAKAQLETAKQATVKARTERSQALLEIKKEREAMRAAREARNPEAYKAAQSRHDKAQVRKQKAEKILSEQKPEKKPAEKPVSSEENHATIEKAIQQGKAIRHEYRAEKAGSREASTFRQKFDNPYELTEKTILTDMDGNPILTDKGNQMSHKTQKAQRMIDEGSAQLATKKLVRVVNENGQPTTRHLEDIRGKVEIVDDEHPFLFDKERNIPVDREGNEVEIENSSLTKDSDLAARLDKMEEIVTKVKSGGKNPSVREILDASKGMSKDAFKKSLEGLSPDEIDTMAKDLGC